MEEGCTTAKSGALQGIPSVRTGHGGHSGGGRRVGVLERMWEAAVAEGRRETGSRPMAGPRVEHVMAGAVSSACISCRCPNAAAPCCV